MPNALILLVVGLLVGAFLGATAWDAWIERRHGCMPHKPDVCKREAGEW